MIDISTLAQILGLNTLNTVVQMPLGALYQQNMYYQLFKMKNHGSLKYVKEASERTYANCILISFTVYVCMTVYLFIITSYSPCNVLLPT